MQVIKVIGTFCLGKGDLYPNSYFPQRNRNCRCWFKKSARVIQRVRQHPWRIWICDIWGQDPCMDRRVPTRNFAHPGYPGMLGYSCTLCFPPPWHYYLTRIYPTRFSDHQGERTKERPLRTTLKIKARQCFRWEAKEIVKHSIEPLNKVPQSVLILYGLLRLTGQSQKVAQEESHHQAKGFTDEHLQYSSF